MQPHRDVRILDAGMMGLDPSIVPSEDFGGARSALEKTGKCTVSASTRPSLGLQADVSARASSWNSAIEI